MTPEPTSLVLIGTPDVFITCRPKYVFIFCVSSFVHHAPSIVKLLITMTITVVLHPPEDVAASYLPIQILIQTC